jgi:hypothetical protein
VLLANKSTRRSRELLFDNNNWSSDRIIYGCLIEFISKKIADIKILYEGYTADYFLNRMKPNALFPILFIQNNLLKKRKPGTDIFYQLLHMCILEKFYRVIFCFLVLIGQYLSRNWLLNT